MQGRRGIVAVMAEQWRTSQASLPERPAATSTLCIPRSRGSAQLRWRLPELRAVNSRLRFSAACGFPAAGLVSRPHRATHLFCCSR